MRKWITNILLVIFAAVFLVSAFMIGKYVLETIQANNQRNELLGLKGDVTRPTLPPDYTYSGETEPPTESIAGTTPTEPAEPGILPELAELYAANSDLVGWVYVPGTNIDYPVMQTDRENDFYLHRDFYRQYSSHGMIFAEERADVAGPSDVVTIYGHNKDDGTMFGDMDFYWDYDFYQENNIIYFDTLTTHYAYEIVTVFNTTATLGEGFSYHHYIDFASASEFDSFMEQCYANAVYNTGVTARYGDKLLLLSTCEYSQVNGRLVIVAKRIGEVK